MAVCKTAASPSYCRLAQSHPVHVYHHAIYRKTVLCLRSCRPAPVRQKMSPLQHEANLPQTATKSPSKNRWRVSRIALTLVVLKFLRHYKSIFFFSVISQDWDGSGGWNPSSWVIRTCLPCMINAIAVVSAAVVLVILEYWETDFHLQWF